MTGLDAMTVSGTLALARSELRLLWRNRLVAATALLLPPLMALGLSRSSDSFGDGGWGAVVGLQILTMLMFAVYAAATTAVAARRGELVLKRLRTSELPEWAVLGGMLAPLVGLAVVQALLSAAMVVAFGAPMPQRPELLLLAVLGGALMCCAAALLTTRITASAEQAQVTTMPLFFIALAGAIWTISVPSDEVTPLMLAVPGSAIAELARIAWNGGGDPLPAIAMIVVWTAVAGELAKRLFRWEPRA
ncbi:ABC transporter permease [Conexibacter sp. JD483]|uniref:ABC transporter permease n=1 Tax=unclassified Conexibacter TaxID=2627773 RepID=UPI00271BBC89|nr:MULTISPECIES: ABC transporter permease [unclassified Conexibacter]MDO8187761.1 ABC transporter permease [Conexibacter sp. CPCC 205706]MDO8201370.1 ABC transporter permease [Conexibacter sp. CPCC 205762]MDR9372855.1 ABC transporter permease [Conexibacter sp. JD483]